MQDLHRPGPTARRPLRRAVWGGLLGLTVFACRSDPLNRPVIGFVIVGSDRTELFVGRTLTASLTVLDRSGDPVDITDANWNSSDTAVARVDVDGLVTGIAPGGVSIIAEVDGVTGRLDLAVALVPVAVVVIEPESDTLEVGSTRELSARLFDEDGTPLSNREVVWVTNDVAVATVTSEGVIEAVSPGSVSVTARSEGREGAAEIVVVPIPAAIVEVVPDSLGLLVGEVAILGAVVRDASGDELSDRPVAWSTGDPGVVTVAADGTVTGVGLGTTPVTATHDGKTGIATVTVSAVPVDTIVVLPADTVLEVGDSVSFDAQLLDADGQDLGNRSLDWTSGDPGVATVDALGLVTPKGEGSTTISAAREGKVGMATLTVPAPPVVAVELSSDSTDVLEGGTQQLMAVPRDVIGGALNGRLVVWEVDDPGVATVDSAGLVTGGQPGRAVVTATSEGVSASAVVRVVLADAEIDFGGWVERGTTVQLIARVDGVVVPNDDIAWTGQPSTVVTILPGGFAQFLEAGTATFTARAVGMAGDTTVGVGVPPTIVFDLLLNANRDIYSISLDGRDLTRITTDTGDDRDPTVVGTNVVFVSFRNGNGELHAIPLAGGPVVALTATAADEGEPTGSADGLRLAFTRAVGGVPKVFVADADGGNAVRVTGGFGFAGSIEGGPAWAPAADRIAFLTTHVSSADIYVFDVAGGGFSPLIPDDNGSADFQPTWSPDGQHVAFSTNRTGVPELHVMNVATEQLTLVTATSGAAGEPAYLTDGRIVYTEWVGGVPSLRWVDPAAPGVSFAIPVGPGDPGHPAPAGGN